MLSKTELTEVRLELLCTDDTEQLLEFELKNKAWFDKFIPPREQIFYSREGVLEHIQQFLLDYKCNQLLPLLIKNESREIIGRLNFTNVDLNKGTAHVGYRIAHQYTSRGVAKLALKKAITELSKKGIKRLFAYVEVSNIASQKVLSFNGFKKVRIIEEFAQLHGEEIHCIEFTCLINKR